MGFPKVYFFSQAEGEVFFKSQIRSHIKEYQEGESLWSSHLLFGLDKEDPYGTKWTIPLHHERELKGSSSSAITGTNESFCVSQGMWSFAALWIGG